MISKLKMRENRREIQSLTVKTKDKIIIMKIEKKRNAFSTPSHHSCAC